MQTIFLATDRDGTCFAYYAGEPKWDGKDFGIGYGSGLNAYRGPNQPPPGECREFKLIPVNEADDKDARIAELERQLATRSPGVMPEVVAFMLKYIGDLYPFHEGLKTHAKAIEAYYAQPFVFDGTDGLYEAELANGKKFTYRVGRVCGDLVALTSANCWLPVASDGTFPGGRIVGRVGE